jgi:hypothetical protein
MRPRHAVLLTSSETARLPRSELNGPTKVLCSKNGEAVTSLESTLVEVFILNNLNLFRMNTYKKQGERPLFAQFWCNVSPFRMNIYEKQGGIVNQISDKKICPEEHRNDRRFRPCRKGPLLLSCGESSSQQAVPASGILMTTVERSVELFGVRDYFQVKFSRSKCEHRSGWRCHARPLRSVFPCVEGEYAPQN